MFETENVYYSRTLNAYDDGDRVVVDLTTFPAPFLVGGRGSGGPAASGTPSLDRWTIDLAAGRVRTRRIDDRPQEFPRINESLVSRRHRFGYPASTAPLHEGYDSVDGRPGGREYDNALIKQDLANGTAQVHRLPRHATAGKAVYVPAEGSAAEDDGHAVAYVADPERGATDLVILSAQDFTGEPVARIHLPGRVPMGLHGSWLSDAS